MSGGQRAEGGTSAEVLAHFNSRFLATVAQTQPLGKGPSDDFPALPPALLLGLELTEPLERDAG